MADNYEEGQYCPDGCGGKLMYPPSDNCSCHINPPCGECSNRTLVCDICAWEDEGAQ